MINLQPNLIGRLIKVRPLLSQDLQSLYQAASDPLIWQQHPDKKRHQREHFTEKYFKPAIEMESALIVQNHNNQVKGCSRYYIYRPQMRDIVIGYTFLSRDCWGGNFNKQLKYLMLRHIYNYVDVVYLNIGQLNHRSRKAAQKIGSKLMNQKQIKDRNIIMPAQSVTYSIDKHTFQNISYFDTVKQLHL